MLSGLARAGRCANFVRDGAGIGGQGAFLPRSDAMATSATPVARSDPSPNSIAGRRPKQPCGAMRFKHRPTHATLRVTTTGVHVRNGARSNRDARCIEWKVRAVRILRSRIPRSAWRPLPATGKRAMWKS